MQAMTKALSRPQIKDHWWKQLSIILAFKHQLRVKKTDSLLIKSEPPEKRLERPLCTPFRNCLLLDHAFPPNFHCPPWGWGYGYFLELHNISSCIYYLYIRIVVFKCSSPTLMHCVPQAQIPWISCYMKLLIVVKNVSTKNWYLLERLSLSFGLKKNCHLFKWLGLSARRK